VVGLDDVVEVRRDRWGVPHIKARTIHDLWFGQGFCHGQDRLWQLELYRRASAGRICEIAGEDALQTDRFLRTLGIRHVAEREAAALSPALRDSLEAHAAGVNEAARSSRSLPAEFQILRLDWDPWTPVDMLACMKLLTFGLSTNWEAELRRADMARLLGEELAAKLDPDYPVGNPLVLDPGGDGYPGFSGDGTAIAAQIAKVREDLGFATGASGSNNWAVSPELSATGGALIAGDPHLSPSMPGIWYTNGLELGDRFCRGASLPGIPGITMGQNNDVCWTFTNLMADVQDLFVERVEDDKYLFEDEWRELDLREEEIAVKGHDEPFTEIVASTHHGPIVNSALKADDAEPLALSWTALQHPSLTEANLGVLEPRDGAELVDLLGGMTMPCSNMIWADKSGSIGYKAVGRLPIRKGDCPDLPRPGWTGEFEWEGTIPYEELPETANPDCGYLVTANNKVEPDDYPHHLTSDYMDGYRAKRIEQMIELASRPRTRSGGGGVVEGGLDLDQFAGMQTDKFSIPGAHVVQRLARLHPRGQRETRVIEILKSWDGEMTPDSVAASVYHAFVIRFAREFGRAAIRDRDLTERWMDRADNGFLEHQTSTWRWYSHLLALWEEGDEELIGRPWDDLVGDALRGALDDLESAYGKDEAQWKWGKVHQLVFPHPLGDANPVLAKIFNRTLEPGGGSETVCQVASDPSHPEHAAWAPSWRMVADPSAPERSRWQQFTGQSGHAGSAYYDDVQDRWLAGKTQLLAGEAPWHTLVLR
jgi:penicillin amidase